MPYLVCWLFKTNIKYKDSDKDGVILRVFPLDGGTWREMESEVNACFL